MFRFLTSGESHGKGLEVIVDGVPAGLPISEEYIAAQLARRQLGYGRGGRMQIERDRAEIIAGVRHGYTLGSPIGMYIENKDFVNWTKSMAVYPVEGEIRRVTRMRPGHADFPGVMKYSHHDVRNVLERSSARETAARVAAGAVARRLLEEFGIELHSHVISIGTVKSNYKEPIDWQKVEESPVRCADPQAEKEMMAVIDKAKDTGDTAGGVFEVIAYGVPVGLGTHVHWDRKLDGRIAQIMMSINAVKGVEIGPGFANTEKPGSQVHDIIEPATGEARPFRHMTNRAGGTEGGISNGEPIVVHAAVKPISTLGKPLPSVDLDTGERVQAHYERSDICQVPPACVIGEACLTLVLAEAFLEKFGGDHLEETRRNYLGFLEGLNQFRPRAAAQMSAERPPDDAV
ncbi:MAG: chorismate synthase [Chloroflexi bacterium]|nr:chorismate synthase [Chloroflexota bacterium]